MRRGTAGRNAILVSLPARGGGRRVTRPAVPSRRRTWARARPAQLALARPPVSRSLGKEGGEGEGEAGAGAGPRLP
eukprot:scaffold401_cov399-Prasinococcus_capsulatus_cf.AAC.35